jgi:hypothetical protein
MMAERVAAKDPDDIDWRYLAWCSKWTGLNDGSAADTGELQGATITGYGWLVPTGLTLVDQNTDAVSIHDVIFAANTIVAIKLSGGVDQVDYTIPCQILTSTGEVLNDEIILPVRSTS